MVLHAILFCKQFLRTLVDVLYHPRDIWANSLHFAGQMMKGGSTAFFEDLLEPIEFLRCKVCCKIFCLRFQCSASTPELSIIDWDAVESNLTEGGNSLFCITIDNLTKRLLPSLGVRYRELPRYFIRLLQQETVHNVRELSLSF